MSDILCRQNAEVRAEPLSYRLKEWGEDSSWSPLKWHGDRLHRYWLGGQYGHEIPKTHIVYSLAKELQLNKKILEAQDKLAIPRTEVKVCEECLTRAAKVRYCSAVCHSNAAQRAYLKSRVLEQDMKAVSSKHDKSGMWNSAVRIEVGEPVVQPKKKIEVYCEGDW